MEYSKLANGFITGVTGGILTVKLPFLPHRVELDNFTAATTPTNTQIVKAIWASTMAQDSAIVYKFNATPVLTTGTVTSNGIKTFSANTYAYGASLTVSSITKANPGVVTTSTNHGYSTGDVVVFQVMQASATTGMQQLANIPFVITVTGLNTFTIPFNTNQAVFTAVTSATVKKVLYPYLFFPGDNVITAISTGTTTTITTSANHNYVVGQLIAFRIPSQWGTVELNSPNNSPSVPPGSALYSYVTSVSSATQFVCDINSTGFTAFAVPTVAQANAGLTLPQVVAVGDNRTGAISSTEVFPPPTTINGPAIAGAFQNNSYQGFLIGTNLSGSTSDVIHWTAYGMDLPNVAS